MRVTAAARRRHAAGVWFAATVSAFAAAFGNNPCVVALAAAPASPPYAAAPAAPAAGAAPTPASTPKPAPSPCRPEVRVSFVVSYGKAVFDTLTCRLGTLGEKPLDEKNRASLSGVADLTFNGPNVQIDYVVTQPCVLSTYGVLYNDNVMLRLVWPVPSAEPGAANLGALIPSAVPSATPRPVALDCTNFTRPSPKPRFTPTPGPNAMPAPAPDPTVSRPRFLIAAADVNGTCQVTLNGNPVDASLCSADSQRSEETGVWKGSLKLPMTGLKQAGVPAEFMLRVTRNVRAGVDTKKVLPPAFNSPTIRIIVDERHTVAHQQFIAAAPSSHSSTVPTHRQSANVYAPLDPYLLGSATFADDSGKVLSTRDSAVGALKVPGAKAFACHSCGVFRSQDAQPFQTPFTSSSALGIDLSAFGVDSAPFSASSSTYSIDAGYKLILAAPATAHGTTAFGAATFDGTTAANGYAHDSVLSLTETAPGTASRFQFGLFHVVADRTVLPTPNPKALPAVTTPLLHSTNSQFSAAYSFSPESLHVMRARTDETLLAVVPPLTYTTLVRYGTQYGASSQVLDVAESINKVPPALDPYSSADERWHFSGALGYRSVGARYNPIDGQFDAHAGEHGLYGSLGYTAPVFRASGFTTATFSLSAYAFSDGVQVRDQAVKVQATYPLSPFWSLQSTDQIGHLSLSQVGRANGFVIADAAHGRDMLPNSQYNMQLTYKRGTTFQVTGGYTKLYAQGCNTKIVTTAQPCYPYRSPAAVGDLAWVPFATSKKALWKSVFVEASVQGSSSSPFRTATDNVLDTPRLNYYETTAGHVVRTAALGAVLFNTQTGCGTLLLTSANRGGDVDNFDKSAPVAGFTNTASMEIVPGRGWPSFVIAYNRTQNTGAAVSPPLFLFRTQFGVPPRNFGQSAKGGC